MVERSVSGCGNQDFSIFNGTTLDLLETGAELRGDQDLGAINDGVPIILLAVWNDLWVIWG
jgi:hypothetical protein